MLQNSRIPNDLMAAMESMYINKEVLSSPVGQTNQVPAAGAAGATNKTEICLLFLEGNCIQPVEQCFGAHYKLPYSWEVLEGHQWTLLDSSEKIEGDYCNPKITYSMVDGGAVWFETMTRGLQKVRRLSSISSVLQPTFLLTTEWLWYWEEEDGNWNQYDSPTNRALEQKFQNNPQEVLEFTAGYQTYTLSLKDMIQTNKSYSTKRLVRRRPRFLSSANVQDIRTSAGATGGAVSSAGVVATGGGERRSPPQDKIEICLFFLEGNCIDPIEKCFGAHYSLPYSWEVLEGHQWMLLDSSEKIEEDYCNPKITYSTVDVEAVCFDTMTCGLQKVRRLSSISSVLQPTFLLTTEWLWYWEDEHGKWNQYDSPPNSSTELEQKFQNNPQEVVEFTAGSQTYTLSLQDMIQTNKRYGTQRQVRRRPRFRSSADVQDDRTSKRPPNGPPNVQAFPRHWDKSQVPEIGHKKVLLRDSSKEYKKVETLFRQTMTAFDIVKIERIQNKSLWDQFQLQREQMKTRNGGHSVAERKLFHGTDSKFIDPICCSNFDWRICGTHGTILGKGSYFARDASYSHTYTSYASTVRSMFVSRVLVGHHTRGSADYVRPPSKDGRDTLFYDSCVDSIRSPSIFVVFDRPQIYPEFLLTYKAKAAVVGDSLSGLLVAIAAAPVGKPTPVVIPTPAVIPTPVVKPTPVPRTTPAQQFPGASTYLKNVSQPHIYRPLPTALPAPPTPPASHCPPPSSSCPQTHQGFQGMSKRMREKASGMDWYSVPGVAPEVKRQRL
ncbi:protein mono-ADP-ribosyltransferase PARP12 isoform X1 [Gadus morhua]|uniref:protein mono-ADP-ribosyltransferase PARP12 isoform X1 n=1 Tax=Gadus morhua TaxID=8049 RepID=UPI0011B755D1|nr:protein mono-ADP-ribosyltransferase PARP12-like isoform X1 [Gadus morhua]XP_030210886.1 protein mono-ADP-ribosyltransferase PARP12-like isoform X1 [Gadus morhua]